MRVDRWGRPAAILLALTMTSAASAQSMSEPAYSPRTYELTARAYEAYRQLAMRGGWRALPQSVTRLKEGVRGPGVPALKERLALLGDLPASDSVGDLFDAPLTVALRRFQARHGLPDTGVVGAQTQRALDTPIEVRLSQLFGTLQRLRGTNFTFPVRYVALNIPAASVEAVENGVVARRYVAVVGRQDRPSPTLEARISTVNINPSWTVPVSIIRKDLMPRMQTDPWFLQKNNMRVIGLNGQELNPASIDWSGRTAINYTVREDPGPQNSLGQLRLDMSNPHSVFMHDTPAKQLFRSEVRFHSSGCARVENVRDLAAWLLEGTDWDRARLDATIEGGQQIDIRLPRPVPVAWVYMTGWGASDGTVQFRDDIYGLDDTASFVGHIATSSATPRQHDAITALLSSWAIDRR